MGDDARTPLEQYTDRLGHALHGPRGIRTDLLREARDHLVDTTEALEAAGLGRAEAERRAVAEFGAVGVVAPEYQVIISSGQTRRIALALLCVTLAQPLAWSSWAEPSRTPADPVHADPVHAGLNQAVEVIGSVTMVVAVLVALLGGAGVRYLGVRIPLVRGACVATLVLSTVIALLAGTMVVTGADPSPAGVAYTFGVAILPFGAVAGVSARCLRTLDRARSLARPRVRA